MIDQRRATRWRSPDEPCLNCGDSTPGRFCPTCGQRKAEVLVSVRALLADVLEDQLVLNRALPRTLSALLFRPGLLTEEYVRGRIVRYIAPFRLYLVSSVLFFLLMSFFGLKGLNVEIDADGQPAVDAHAGVDSAVSAIRAEQQALEAMDTTLMSDSARAALVETLDGVAAGLERLDTTAAADSTLVRRQIDADSALPTGVRQPWARDMNFNQSSPMFRRALERKLDQVGHLPFRDALRELARDLLEYAPHMVFLMLPLFALMLKLLYIRRDRYYAEHFVFALHVHAFVFVMFTVAMLIPWDWISPALLLWIMAYAWLAMKRVYRQGWFRTTLKWWTLGWTYFWVLLFGVSCLAIVTLLFT